MSPKRPPRAYANTPATQWNPGDTQRLRLRVDLAHETEWRRSTVDQIENMATTLGDTRDLARENRATLETKASKQELEKCVGKIAVVANSVFWLRLITVGALLAIVTDIGLHLRGVK